MLTFPNPHLSRPHLLATPITIARVGLEYKYQCPEAPLLILICPAHYSVLFIECMFFIQIVNTKDFFWIFW